MPPWRLIVLLALCAAVVFVLVWGLFTMARGEDDGRRSNILMRWRVGLQLATILIFAALMVL